MTGPLRNMFTVHSGICRLSAGVPKSKASAGAGGIAAAVVLAVIAEWLALGKFVSRGESWRQASLDLRGHEAFRGAGAPKRQCTRAPVRIDLYGVDLYLQSG
jgi:hypothetical protein